MKTHIIIGGLMLVIGIAIGWVSKPDDERTSVTAGSFEKSATLAPQLSVASPTPGKRAIRPIEQAKTESDMPTAKQIDRAKQMQSEMFKKMVDRQREKYETQIDRLTENLSLTNAQKSKLTAWLDERLKNFENIDLKDPTTAEKFMEESKLLNDETLQAQLSGTLTPKQQSALVEYKERDHHGKVDTIALKSLSNLQGVIQFEDGQRDKVYEILTESAEESLATESKTTDISSIYTEGTGIEMDPYGLGIQQAMSEAMSDPNQVHDRLNQQNTAKTMRQIINGRIDAKVEKLRPILNDKQIDAYRAELRTKGIGVYSTVLESMEKGSE